MRRVLILLILLILVGSTGMSARLRSTLDHFGNLEEGAVGRRRTTHDEFTRERGAWLIGAQVWSLNEWKQLGNMGQRSDTGGVKLLQFCHVAQDAAEVLTEPVKLAGRERKRRKRCYMLDNLTGDGC